ncbi:MAG: transaldolase/EF-hand domain-containing protein [Syntrophorhabdus sp. PtaU1.Bin058]|nr:MAG: transaldolase/EF-hand domain-containing protein [Syntrophorhabdus sp. PtaU1.Bin058]
MISAISGSASYNQYYQVQMRQQMSDQQQMFSSIDTNGDGKLDTDELAKMVSMGPKDGPSAEDILNSSDTDGDGYVSESEFEAAAKNGPKMQGPPPPPMTGGAGNMSSEDFVEMFNQLDTDGDGTIDADELSQMVAMGPEDGPSAEELLNQLDTDEDGTISESEFMSGLQANQQAQRPQGGSDIDKMFSSLDTDGDGTISKNEFETAMGTANNSVQGNNSDDTLFNTLLDVLDSEDSTTSSTSNKSGSLFANAMLALSSMMNAYMQAGSQWNNVGSLTGSGSSIQV